MKKDRDVMLRLSHLEFNHNVDLYKTRRTRGLSCFPFPERCPPCVECPHHSQPCPKNTSLPTQTRHFPKTYTLLRLNWVQTLVGTHSLSDSGLFIRITPMIFRRMLLSTE